MLDWLDQLDPQDVYISVITIGELRKGIALLPPSPRRAAMMQWLETDLMQRFAGHIAEVTIAVMLRWGELVGRLAQAGTPMPAIDSMIAALAREGQFALVTRNDGDVRNAGITVIHPWKLVRGEGS